MFRYLFNRFRRPTIKSGSLLFEDIHRLGNTIIVVTHEPDIALRARRVVRLIDGEVEYDKMNEVPAESENS